MRGDTGHRGIVEYVHLRSRGIDRICARRGNAQGEPFVGACAQRAIGDFERDLRLRLAGKDRDRAARQRPAKISGAEIGLAGVDRGRRLGIVDHGIGGRGTGQADRKGYRRLAADLRDHRRRWTDADAWRRRRDCRDRCSCGDRGRCAGVGGIGDEARIARREVIVNCVGRGRAGQARCRSGIGRGLDNRGRQAGDGQSISGVRQIGIGGGRFALQIVEQRRAIGDPPGIAERLVELRLGQGRAQHGSVGQFERVRRSGIGPQQPFDRARRGAGRQVDGVIEILPVVGDIDGFAGLFGNLVRVLRKLADRPARQRQRIGRGAEPGSRAVDIDGRCAISGKGHDLVADLDPDFGGQRRRTFPAAQRRQADLHLEIVAGRRGFGEHEFADCLKIEIQSVECCQVDIAVAAAFGTIDRDGRVDRLARIIVGGAIGIVKFGRAQRAESELCRPQDFSARNDGDARLNDIAENLGVGIDIDVGGAARVVERLIIAAATDNDPACCKNDRGDRSGRERRKPGKNRENNAGACNNHARRRNRITIGVDIADAVVRRVSIKIDAARLPRWILRNEASGRRVVIARARIYEAIGLGDCAGQAIELERICHASR